MIEHMCEICDGRSPEELRRALATRVDACGWAIVGVEADPPWCYTIGLLERFGHPELVVTGVEPHHGASLLNAVGAAIREGGRYTGGDTATAAGRSIGFVTVHPAQVDHGVFAAWFDHYRFGPADCGGFAALQVVLAESDEGPRLDRPDDALGAGRPPAASGADRRRGHRRAGRRRPSQAGPPRQR